MGRPGGAALGDHAGFAVTRMWEQGLLPGSASVGANIRPFKNLPSAGSVPRPGDWGKSKMGQVLVLVELAFWGERQRGTITR